MADVNSIYCPSCRTHTNLIRHTFYEQYPHRYSVEECNNCSQHFLVIRSSDRSIILQIYPRALPDVVDELVPDEIKSVFEEALLCESVGAHKGAAALARRCVQMICVDKGASKKKKLFEQIGELLKNGTITNNISEWAHEIRYIGNDGAHPLENDVSSEEANDILDLLESMCDVLYVAPAKAAKRKEIRQKTSSAEINP